MVQAVPQNVDPQLRLFLQSLAEQVQVGLGHRGEGADKNVTWGDLVEADIAKFFPSVGFVNPLYAPGEGSGTPPSVEYAEVVGSLDNFMVTFALPSQSSSAWSHLEIWGYEHDGIAPTINKAALLGVSATGFFTYNPARDGTSDSWVFFFRYARGNAFGPWYDTAGSIATRPESPESFFNSRIQHLGMGDLPGLDSDLSVIFGEALVDDLGNPISHAQYLIDVKSQALQDAADAADAASTDAANSASDAANSASDALTQASDAAGSASDAANSASDAAGSASNAVNQASDAAGSASDAVNQASDAAGSASDAANSASDAAGSASNAATQASKWSSALADVLNTDAPDAPFFEMALSQINAEAEASVLQNGFGLFVNASAETVFTVAADNFCLFDPAGTTLVEQYPFFVSGGTTYIKSAMIQEATITDLVTGSLISDRIVAGNVSFGSAQIANGAITNAKISGTLQSGSASDAANTGWKLEQNGKFSCVNGEFRGVLSAAVVESGMLVKPSFSNMKGIPTLRIFSFYDDYNQTGYFSYDVAGFREIGVWYGPASGDGAGTEGSNIVSEDGLLIVSLDLHYLRYSGEPITMRIADLALEVVDLNNEVGIIKLDSFLVGDTSTVVTSAKAEKIRRFRAGTVPLFGQDGVIGGTSYTSLTGYSGGKSLSEIKKVSIQIRSSDTSVDKLRLGRAVGSVTYNNL